MMDGSDDDLMSITEDEERQNYSLKKRERETEIADTLSKIENGTLEIYRSSGVSPAWRKFMQIRDTTSKQRINYVQCIECKVLLTYKEHGGTTHLNRHKCKINDPSAECLPFRRIPDERVDEVQKVLIKNITKFCAENLSTCEAVCGSANFINFLQSFVTMGQNLGNIELQKIFPKSNTVQQKIEKFKDENQRKIYSKFREASKNGWCSLSLRIEKVFSATAEKSVIFMKIQYLEADMSALTNKVVVTTGFTEGVSPNLFLTKIMNLFNDFGGHEQDLMALKIVTDKKPIFAESLTKFTRQNCIADKIIDILNEAFQVSPNQETKDLLATCKAIVSILLKSEKHNLNLIQDNSTWINKFLLVQSIADQYSDIAVILEIESRVDIHINKRRAEEFISFLEPFIEALRDLSSNSYTTANRVLLWWTVIRDHLRTFQNYSYELKHMMVNAMKLFKSKFLPTIDNKIDCFFDPRYKMLKMLDETERSEVIEEVKKRLEGTVVDEIATSASTSTGPTVKKARFTDLETKKGDSRKVLPKKVTKKSKEDKKNENRFKRYETNADENVNKNDEVEIYLKMPPVKSSEFGSEFDVLSKFWKSQQKLIPKLYKLATSRLHIPATCGCVAESISRQQQHHLNEQALHDLLFIRDKLEVSI